MRPALRRPALVVAFAPLLACAGPPRALSPSPLGRAAPSAAATPAEGAAHAVPHGEDVPALERLAARGPTDAPLMRESRRVADATRVIELGALGADTCFRAIVAASHPVRSWFEDGTHASRGEVAGASGLVPPRGPACAKKGETLRLVVVPSSDGTLARAVVWQSP